MNNAGASKVAFHMHAKLFELLQDTELHNIC